MSMRTGQTGAHRSARVGRVIEPVHLSAEALTLLIVNHGAVAVSGVAPRRSLEAEMLRCRGVDLHQIWFWAPVTQLCAVELVWNPRARAAGAAAAFEQQCSHRRDHWRILGTTHTAAVLRQ